MSEDVLLRSDEDGMAILTINRPKALNALNHAVMESLHTFFSDLDGIRQLSGVIITGSGEKAFVAGADIKGFNFEEDATKDLGRFGHQVFNHIEQCSVPVIAAVNGFALGGGCELAMACHMRVASTQARFGQPEINLGIIPGYGGTQRLPQLVGKGRALELLLTADLIDAQEAYRIGLVNHVVEAGQAVEKAKEILKKISSKAPIAAELIIQVVNEHFYNYEGGMEAEISAFARSFATEDAREGVNAFIEKRKPSFKGK